MNLPDSLITIGDRAFMLTSPTTVTIPEGVTSIGAQAFYCPILATVTIPASVTSIGEGAFDFSTRLTTVNAPCNWDGSLYTFGDGVTVKKAEHTPKAGSYADNGDDTHSFTCSVCGGTVIEAHNYTYDANDDTDTITESCGKGCGYDATITLKAPENLVYDGKEKEATVDGSMIGTYEITYEGDRKNIGICTATLTAGGQTVSIAFTIAPATIADAVITVESVIYNGEEQAPNSDHVTVTVGGVELERSVDYTIGFYPDHDFINAGDYAITIYGEGNYTGSVETTFTIEKKALTLKLTDCSKEYDGTADLTTFNAEVAGFIFYDEGSYESDVLDYDDVYDDVSVDEEKLTVTLPDCKVGAYTTAKVSGITLIGENALNYTLAVEIAEVPIEGYYSDFEISKASIDIQPDNQSVVQGSEIDKTAYTLSKELPAGHTMTGVVLKKDGTTIKVDGEVVITNADGTDVTDCFDINTNLTGIVTETCEGHTFNDYGFCATGQCDAYQAAPLDDNGTEDTWDDYYEIYNAGQLYWFAQRVNEYGKTDIGAVLMDDISIPATKSQGGTVADWSPINGLYADFDGKGHTVSGLYVKSEGSNIGMFGSSGYYTIRNLMVTDSYFEGGSNVGAIAGYNQGTIENCGVGANVTVTGDSSVGLLVGNNAGTVRNCYAYGSSCVGYYNSSYATIENSYYLSETETEDGGKTAAQFKSGEVAYLLQSGVTIYDEELGDYTTEGAPHIWGQTIGTDSYPVLGGDIVYRGVDCRAKSATAIPL